MRSGEEGLLEWTVRLQDHMIEITERAREEAFRYARAVPAERLNWSPLGAGQTVMKMVRELAQTPDWAYWVLTDAKPEDPENAAAEQRREMESWVTVDQCEAVCQEKLGRLYELYRGYTDDDLARTKWLPFNGGREHSIAELLDYPRWNFTYHLGQIAYIQSLYDDRELH